MQISVPLMRPQKTANGRNRGVASKSPHVLLPVNGLPKSKGARLLWRKAQGRMEEVLGEAKLRYLSAALFLIRQETIVEA